MSNFTDHGLLDGMSRSVSLVNQSSDALHVGFRLYKSIEHNGLSLILFPTFKYPRYPRLEVDLREIHADLFQGVIGVLPVAYRGFLSQLNQSKKISINGIGCHRCGLNGRVLAGRISHYGELTMSGFFCASDDKTSYTRSSVITNVNMSNRYSCGHANIGFPKRIAPIASIRIEEVSLEEIERVSGAVINLLMGTYRLSQAVANAARTLFRE